MNLLMILLAAEFAFTPVPRWAEEPETEVLCAAVRAECSQFAGKTEIETEVSYDEIYDVNGMLSGIRMTRASGCAPIDEHLLLSQRRFKMAFHKPDRSDLDGIYLETLPGVDPAKVRIVKPSGTNFSLGCN